MTEVFLTVEQAAGRLQVAPYTLREWIKRGKVRAIRPGRVWRIPERALDELTNTGNANNTNDDPLAKALQLVGARDARLASQGKARNTFNVADDLNAMRDERLAELSDEQ